MESGILRKYLRLLRKAILCLMPARPKIPRIITADWLCETYDICDSAYDQFKEIFPNGGDRTNRDDWDLILEMDIEWFCREAFPDLWPTFQQMIVDKKTEMIYRGVDKPGLKWDREDYLLWRIRAFVELVIDIWG
jgi:hypothetical protein